METFLFISLIFIVFLTIWFINKKINAPRKILKNSLILANDQLAELEKEIVSLKRRINIIEEKRLKLEKGIEEKDELFLGLKKKSNSRISKITSLYSDFLLVQFNLTAEYLERKKHPAISESLRIKELKEESKIYLKQYREMVYRYEYLFQLFPELSSYADDFETISQLEEIESIGEFQENFDRVQNYVSKEEFLKLNIHQRNQLALDRYIKGQKTKWQIGRDFELFCGMEYEKQGWDVIYIGIEKKLEDMGRDLIAKKGNEHHVIQCKYWSKGKVIHEKHITQLFGTTIEYSMDFGSDIKVLPVFITNISLSERAYEFAFRLGVLVKDNKPLEEFPRIKCNLNKDEYGNETKIYHLPFDQQYDRTKIDKKGEFFAYKVEEAVKNGFRRAFKYHG